MSILKNSSLYKNSIWLIINSGLVSLCGFLFWIFSAKYFSPHDIGINAALISSAGFLATTSIFGIDQAIIKYLNEDENSGIISFSFLFVIISSTIILAISVFANYLFRSTFAIFPFLENIGDYFVFWLLIISLVMSSLVSVIFIADRKSWFVFIFNAIVYISRIVLLWFTSFGLLHIAIIFSISLMVASLFAIIFIYKSHKIINVKFSLIKRIWKYASGNYLFGIINALPGLVMPIIIINIIGASGNAYFYIVSSIVSAITAVAICPSQALLAEGFVSKNNLMPLIKKTIKFSLLITVTMCICIFFGGKILLSLFGEEYIDNGFWLMFIMSISVIFFSMTNIYINLLRILSRMKIILLLLLISVSINLGLSYLLTRTGNISGIGISYLIANILVGGYSLYMMRRGVKIELD